MKKYLMTGMAAIAFCAAFTSCSKDENLYDPNAIKEMETAQIYEAYNEAFIATFGQVHPNQTWGFGSHAGTRAYNPDANIWGSTYHLDVPQVITEEQKKRVIAYFQNNQFNPGLGSQNLTEFFVQQVYKGGEDNGKYVNIMKATTPLTTEQYESAGMTSPQYGSNHMDRLFANNDPNDHMGNYNNGNMSWNYNVENTNLNIQYLNPMGNGQHADQIQYMYSTKATGFGYHCSEPSIQYDDHYVLVDGSVIDAWATTSGGGIGESVSGRAFVGFDFDLLTPDDWYTDDNFKITDLSSAITLCTDLDGKAKPLADVNLAGDYIYNQQTVKYLHQNATNMISGDIIYSVDNKCGMQDLQDPWGKTFSKAYIDGLIRDGYRPVKGAPSTWIKPEITRDYYFSDWIVSIVPGNTTIEEPNKVRIMAEDLNATAVKAEGDIEKSDWDFNDVVFDVTFNENGTATVQLIAAGGVLPLTVDGHEVHEAFGQSIDPKTGWYPMINTGGIAQVSGATAQPFTVTNPGVDGIDIEIKVNKYIIDADGNRQDNWVLLTAKQGQPAAKFAVKPSVNPLPERTHIDYQSGGAFSRAVTGGNWIWW